MTKKNVMPVVVLAVISVIVAALLALVNILTAPVIAEADFAATKASLKEVMPDGDFAPDPEELGEDAPETVRAVYKDKNGGGYAVVIVTNKGYTGKDIGLTVGIDNDGKVINLKITKNEESIVPGNMKPGGNYGDAYKGVSKDDIAELVTGATVSYTESAIKDAVSEAIAYLLGESNEKPEGPVFKTDEELLLLAAELNPVFTELTFVEKQELEYERNNQTYGYKNRIYRDKSGKNFFAYVVTTTKWNPFEAELVLALDSLGRVTATKLLSWNLSPTYEHKDTPGDDFVASLVGKDEATLPGVELVTNATETSTSVRTAVLAVSSSLALPTSEEKIAEIAGELLSESVTLENITPDGINDMVRRIYLASDSSYVVYIVTATMWNKHEAELVVTFNGNGNVTGTRLLAWNLSPTYDKKDTPGDDFVAGLVGENEASLPDVELVSDATETSTRVRDALLAAAEAISLPTPESKILSDANELFGKDGEYTNVTPQNAPAGVKRIYRNADGSYVLYILTSTEWNPRESELVIAFDNCGKIVGTKLLTWQLSPTYEYNDIPGDGFAAGLVGKTEETLPDVELITHVTETSGRIKGAITSAYPLMQFEGTPGQAARIVGFVILALAVIVPTAVYIIKRRKRG